MIPVRERRQKIAAPPVEAVAPVVVPAPKIKAKPTKKPEPQKAKKASETKPDPRIDPIDADSVYYSRSRPFVPIPKNNVPKIPLRCADFPEGMLVVRGFFSLKRGVMLRPFLYIKIVCPHCSAIRTMPWRGDWPIDYDIVSLQIFRCPDKTKTTVLVGLDPEKHDENMECLTKAQEAFVAWKIKFDEHMKQKRAAKKAKKEGAVDP